MKRLEDMTLREKVGQLFMIRPDTLEEKFGPAELEDNNRPGTARITPEMAARYQRYPCGGFALFAKNILSPQQLREFTAGLRQLGDIPSLLAIDEEGGRVARIANHAADFGVEKTPPMAEIGESGDPGRAFAAGKYIGTYLSDYGFDIDFAPVADVNTNPENIVIGKRAFGSDPAAAARMVEQAVAGLRAAGILSCLKHFPGHGDTSADTHTGYAETKKTWSEIQACEMLPFQAGIAAGADLIMTAHIAAPAVTGSPEPASLSPLLLTGKLRQEMGFAGVIITDALAMGAIRQHYASAPAAVAALQAGADILLMPYNYYEAFEGVLRAVEDGTIPEKRIDESLRRVMALKARRFGGA